MGKKTIKPKIRYADLWGLREEKYKWLEEHDVENTKWQEISSKDPYYFLVPKEEKGWKKYEKFWKITDIFPVNSVGVVTGRDNFVIDEDRRSLETRIRNFIESEDNDEFIKNAYNLKDKPASNWFVKNAREKLRKDESWEKCYTEILYRPFDTRWIFYHTALVERPRENVMRHMLKPNLAIITTRQQTGDDFCHSFVADKIPESCFISNKTREIGYVFPLWLYGENNEQSDLFSNNNKRIPTQNLNNKLWDYLGPDYIGHALPEDIFNYIYAILYSNSYRHKYQEFLKTDFPRIPFTRNYRLFQRVSELGGMLVGLHLLKSAPADRNQIILDGKGDAKIEKIEWKMNEIWINNTQKFTPIPKEVWNYYIGGYQVLQKWLKDRKGRELSSGGIKHYCKIVTAIKSTIEIQKEIDRSYSKVEENLIQTK